jgi:hypothetical protein
MSADQVETPAPVIQDRAARCCGGLSMFKKVFLAVAAIFVVLAAFVAMQPADFRVERSIVVAAPAAAVFAQVNDFHNWDAWSPWLKLDPDAKNSYEGPSSGTGAVFKWSGNGNVGEGSMTIMDSEPAERIGIKLEFVRPFAGVNTAEFRFKPDGEQTLVTWSMWGERNFVCKAIGLCISMDRMIGDKFEEGLAAMKSAAEAASEKSPQATPAEPSAARASEGQTAE